MAALGDALVVDIFDDVEQREERHVLWPATGETRRIFFPGTVWSVPGWPGALAWHETDETSIVRHLAGPDAWPRVILEDVEVAFVTLAGQIVFTRPDGSNPLRFGSLAVMLPDETVIELDAATSWAFGEYFWDPVRESGGDEVFYLAEDGERLSLRRTVLPRVGE